MSSRGSYSLEEKMEYAKRLVEFGHTILTLRNERNLSLEDVGKELDVSRNYISELERGKKTPSDMMIRDIAQFFKMNETDLFAILGKIPLGTLELLENNPTLANGMSEITRMYNRKKITREQMEELIEEMQQVYDKFLKSLED